MATGAREDMIGLGGVNGCLFGDIVGMVEIAELECCW